MYSKIMVPVDLAHTQLLEPSLSVAADIAKLYQASVHYVGVTATTPGTVARTPQEYQQKLEAFARQQAQQRGHQADAHMLTSNDPVAQLDDLLIGAVSDIGADLIVMATHLPKHLDAFMPSHGGKVATHTEVSVFLVRPNPR